MDPWTKQMMNFWQKSVSGMYSAQDSFPGASSRGADQYSQSGSENPWEMPFKMAQSMCESFLGMWGGNTGAAGQKKNYADMMMSMMQMGLEEYVELQQKWMREIAGSSMFGETGEHEGLMKITSMWLDSAQKIIRPLLNAPTVGLTRSYQEQANQVIDKYYTFSSSLTQLLHHLNVPMDAATKVVREQMEGMTKEGGIDIQDKQFYDKWVATLESNYMEMFKTPDYIHLLSKTVDSYSDFLTAQQQVAGNSLRSLPVATTKDMDELSKEIYVLKKRLRELSKKMDSQFASAADNGNGHPYDGQQ
jgi:hypothetical protein